MVDIRKARIDDLGCHETGKHFLRPYIVKPFHRDQVAEPHVRRLVRNQPGTPEQTSFRRRFIEKQAGCAILDRADVFHTPVLERRNQGEPELLERIASALANAKMHGKAGELFEQMDQLQRALESYIRGHDYRHAVELARRAFPGQVCMVYDVYDIIL